MNMKLVKPARFESGRVESVIVPAGAAPLTEGTQILPFADRIGEVDVEFDPHSATYWNYFNPRGRPCFTPALLRSISEMQQAVKNLCAGRERAGQCPVRYFVAASRSPGVFNLGGDLHLLIKWIRAGDRENLRNYALACIDVLYNNAVALDLPIISIALVQGDALGGGFEAALSNNMIVAEKDAKFGLPEILFNLVPGMGAYSFLSRRLDARRAEQIILSGRIYSAQELYDIGVIDVLADNGRGEDVVRDFIAQDRRRHNAHRALYRIRQSLNPLTFEELVKVTNIWVETALELNDTDLRKMERLIAAQNRRSPENGKDSVILTNP